MLALVLFRRLGTNILHPVLSLIGIEPKSKRSQPLGFSLIASGTPPHTSTPAVPQRTPPHTHPYAPTGATGLGKLHPQPRRITGRHLQSNEPETRLLREPSGTGRKSKCSSCGKKLTVFWSTAIIYFTYTLPPSRVSGSEEKESTGPGLCPPSPRGDLGDPRAPCAAGAGARGISGSGTIRVHTIQSRFFAVRSRVRGCPNPLTSVFIKATYQLRVPQKCLQSATIRQAWQHMALLQSFQDGLLFFTRWARAINSVSAACPQHAHPQQRGPSRSWTENLRAFTGLSWGSIRSVLFLNSTYINSVFFSYLGQAKAYFPHPREGIRVERMSEISSD